MRYTLEKFGQPEFRVSIPNSETELFFVAQNRTTGIYVVFGPAEDGSIGDCHMSRDFRTAAEMAAMFAISRAIVIAKNH